MLGLYPPRGRVPVPPIPPNPIVMLVPLVVEAVVLLLVLAGYFGLARRLDKIIQLLERRGPGSS